MSSTIGVHLYEFDTLGYTIIEDCLSRSEITHIQNFWDNNINGFPLVDINFFWSKTWASLINHPSYFSFISEIFEKKLRLDHAYCIDNQFLDNIEDMHHSPDPNSGLYSIFIGGRIYCGLVSVSISLGEIGYHQGGFCCVPGSHKSNFPPPKSLMKIGNNRSVSQIQQKAGSAIIFNEALLHGTYPPDNNFKRRSIILRYTPQGLTFRKPTDDASSLPETPMHEGRRSQVPHENFDLTEEQTYLTQEFSYVRDRKSITSL